MERRPVRDLHHSHPEGRSLVFDLILEDWSFHPEESGLRHEFRLEWLSNLEVGLRFRPADGACTGEPVAACTGGGCELQR